MAERLPLLFDRLPALRERVAWTDLGLAASPVEPLAALGREIGHDALFIKRDDRLSPIYGGSKGRKLEFVLGEALARGSRTLIGLGTTGSNQCVANAAFGRHVGLHVVAAVVPQPLLPVVRRNLLLDLHFGSEFLVAPDDAALGELVVARLRADPTAFLVAPGGSTPVGNLGLVEAALELAGQVERGELPAPDRIVLAGGSAGSAAGLQVGLRLAGLATRVHVVQASAPAWCSIETLARQRGELETLLGLAPATSGPEPVFDPSAFGAGYAIPTREALDALVRLRQAEGIELDACYTAKAFAALLRHVAGTPGARGETLLFWHTANGVDFGEVLRSVDYRGLPRELHAIFEEPLPDHGLGGALAAART